MNMEMESYQIIFVVVPKQNHAKINFKHQQAKH
jgi:hypothetical protein